MTKKEEIILKKIKLSHFEFEYNPIMDCICDERKNRLIFISNHFVDIHLAIELRGTALMFIARWNIKIVADEQQPNKYILDVHCPDETINLEG